MASNTGPTEAEQKQLADRMARFTIQPDSAYPLQMMKRPGFGTLGRPLQLMANLFEMKFQEGEVFHYDVDIQMARSVRQPDDVRLLRQMLEHLRNEGHFGQLRPVFDGRKNMYTFREPLPQDPFEIELPYHDDPDQAPGAANRPKRTYIIKIRLVSQFNLTTLSEYLRGVHTEMPREALQALDVAMLHFKSMRLFPFGRSLFERHPLDLGGGMVLWKGSFQSVRPTQSGLMLNIDQAATAVLPATNIVDYLVAALNRRHPDDLVRMAREIETKVKAVKVRATHTHFTMKVTGVSSMSPADATFEQTEEAGGGPGGRTISVAQYFQEKYQVRLQYPNLPCLMVGSRGNLMPMELLEICEGQRRHRDLNGQQTAKMLNQTATLPAQRMETIRAGVPDGNDPFAQKFGLQVNNRMVQVQGRILPPPVLAYKDSGSRQPCKVQSDRGTWRIEGRHLFEASQLVNTWALINFADEETLDERTTQIFMGKLAGLCASHGVNIDQSRIFYKRVPIAGGGPGGGRGGRGGRGGGRGGPRGGPRGGGGGGAAAQGGSPEQIAYNTMMGLVQELPGPPQMIMCITRFPTDPIYHPIKQVGDLFLSVPTQCMAASNIADNRKNNATYWANLLLKINVKLGGHNTHVDGDLPLFDRPTMVMGADVYHPAPGSAQSSIAAAVASYDRHAAKYHTEWRAQPSRVEHISSMGEMTTAMLENFRQKCGTLPQRLIVYRDGVSEGQFLHVFNEELPMIKKACSDLQADYQPMITVVIVQKRNHVRFFPGGRDGDKNGNMLAGTIVDRDVCSPAEYDFFLCSHAGLKGTSKPTHYFVLTDENNFSPDQMQDLTNKLCYVYARCNRAVSIPAPVYYADLAAYRARLYLDNKGNLLSAQSAERLNTLKNVIFFG